MKIRTDFVTNSSSSSFILGFHDEKTLCQELVEAMPEWFVKDYIGTLITDIKDKKRLTAQEVIDEHTPDQEWEFRYQVKRNAERSGMNFREADEYADSAEGKKEADELYQKWLDELHNNLKKYNFFAEVEYCDHFDPGCTMEHEVMPQMANLVLYQNNH